MSKANGKPADIKTSLILLRYYEVKFQRGGSNYKLNRPDLDKLKLDISQKANGITFIEIHELYATQGRVVLFQIPAALQGIPTSWEGQFCVINGGQIWVVITTNRTTPRYPRYQT